jgi:hypothetical protein
MKTLTMKDVSIIKKNLSRSPASTVRPSVAFQSMSRDQKTQKIYVDQYDGPSSLLIRDGIPNLIEKTDKTIYEQERQEHLDKMQQTQQQLQEAKERLRD